METIKCLQDLIGSKCLNGFSFQHLGDAVVYYTCYTRYPIPYKYHRGDSYSTTRHDKRPSILGTLENLPSYINVSSSSERNHVNFSF